MTKPSDRLTGSTADREELKGAACAPHVTARVVAATRQKPDKERHSIVISLDPITVLDLPDNLVTLIKLLHVRA
jgi:hypothetical protein